MAPLATIATGLLALAGSVSAAVAGHRPHVPGLVERFPMQIDPRGDDLVPLKRNDVDQTPTIQAGEPVVLAPLRPDHSAKMRKRAITLSPFQLLDNSQLLWAGKDGTLAELIIDLPGETEALVNTEEIDDLIQAMSCPRNTTGPVQIEFKEQADLHEATKTWSWVKQSDKHHILLLVGAGDCGWNKHRILYRVTSINWVQESRVATLVATRTSFKAELHSYELNIGKEAGLSLKRRGLFGWIGSVETAVGGIVNGVKTGAEGLYSDAKTAVGGAVTAVETAVGGAVTAVETAVQTAVAEAKTIAGEVETDVGGAYTAVKTAAEAAGTSIVGALQPDLSPDLNIPFNTNLNGKGISFDMQRVHFVGNCDTCTTNGSFDARARFKTTNFKLDEAYVELSTGGIDATVIMDLTLKGDLTNTLLSKELPIFEFSPGGVSIPEVVSLGPTIKLALVGTVNAIRGGVTLTVGGSMTLPSSTSRLDFLSKDNTTSDGWDPTFSPKPLKANTLIQARASVSLTASIGLDLTAIANGFRANFFADLPYLAAYLTATHSLTCSACNSMYQNAISGSVSLGTDVGVSLQKETDGTYDTLWTLSFYNGTMPPLASFCEPVGPQGTCTVSNTTSSR